MEEQGEGAVSCDPDAHAQRQRSRYCSRWRLALAVALPYVLLTALMAAVTLRPPPRSPPAAPEDLKADEIFIQFEPIAVVRPSNQELSFKYFVSNRVELLDQREILVPCHGPYLLHAYVCSQGLDQRPGAGRLELRLGPGPGGGAPPAREAVHLPLESGAAVTCVGLQASAYLRRKERATLHLTSPQQNLRVTSVKLGLHYQLGQCLF